MRINWVIAFDSISWNKCSKGKPKQRVIWWYPPEASIRMFDDIFGWANNKVLFKNIHWNFKTFQFSVCHCRLGFKATRIMPCNQNNQNPIELFVQCGEQRNSSQPDSSEIRIMQNKTPEKRLMLPPGKVLDLISPIEVKRACRQIAGVLSTDKQKSKTKNIKWSHKKTKKKASLSSNCEEVILNDSDEEQDRLSDYEL